MIVPEEKSQSVQASDIYPENTTAPKSSLSQTPLSTLDPKAPNDFDQDMGSDEEGMEVTEEEILEEFNKMMVTNPNLQ